MLVNVKKEDFYYSEDEIKQLALNFGLSAVLEKMGLKHYAFMLYIQNEHFYAGLPDRLVMSFIRHSKYKSIYLVCQPVDARRPAAVKEYNQAEILEFLRKNKKMDRFVPDWIEAPNAEKIAKLSEILRRWTQSQFKEEGQNLLDDLFSTQKTVAEKPSLTTKLSQKFKLENFDLIVWEYISK